MDEQFKVTFTVFFENCKTELLPKILKEVCVYNTFNNIESRYCISEDGTPMIIPVIIKKSEIVSKENVVKLYDSIIIEVIAESPRFANEGRSGSMKNGNTSFTLEDICKTAQKSALDSDGPQTITKTLTVKTANNLPTGAVVLCPDDQTAALAAMLGDKDKLKYDDQSPLSESAVKLFSKFEESKITVENKTTITHKYLLEKSGCTKFTSTMDSFIIYMFQSSKSQPVTNFFYKPPRRTTHNGDLGTLYVMLFLRAAQYYFKFMKLSDIEQQTISSMISSTEPNSLEPTKYFDHLSNIYVMAICLLSECLPYISDQAQMDISPDEKINLMTEAEKIKENKMMTPEEVTEALQKLWMKLCEEEVKPIESWNDCFSMESCDCEDSAEGITLMHNAFIHYVNSKKSKDDSFAMPLMARIALNYVCFACLASVTSDHPTEKDYENGVYPVMNEQWLNATGTIGGHMFCIFVPLKELRVGGAFYGEKTGNLRLKPTTGSLAEDLLKLPHLQDLPVLCGEGTAYGNPAPSVWKYNYKDQTYWTGLQKSAVEVCNASTELMKIVQFRGATSTMVSKEVNDGNVTGNYFYRHVALCFTGTNYLYEKSDQYVPNAFLWVNTVGQSIGAATTDIMYKRNSKLVALDDFYSTTHLDDPTATPEWELFNKLKNYMRPTQIPQFFPNQENISLQGFQQGKVISWFLNPKDLSDEGRAMLKQKLDDLLDPHKFAKYKLQYVEKVNGYTISNPAIYYATMSYPGDTENSVNRKIGRCEVVIYYTPVVKNA